MKNTTVCAGCRIIRLYVFILFAALRMAAYAQAWISDMGDGTYRTPVVMADYSDPDVLAGNDGYFHLTASSFASTRPAKA